MAPEVEEQPGGTLHEMGGPCHIANLHQPLQAACCRDPVPRACRQETPHWKWAVKGGKVLTSLMRVTLSKETA